MRITGQHEFRATRDQVWDALQDPDVLAGTLPGALERAAPVDYAFVDAEHAEEATMGYFEGIVPHMSPRGVMVFDDIPWSRELRRTWRRIARDDRVSAAFALGRMGVAVIADRQT